MSKELGKGKAAARRIPCACDACLAQLDAPWKPGVAAEAQPRFASSTKCIFWPIFKRADGVKLPQDEDPITIWAPGQ